MEVKEPAQPVVHAASLLHPGRALDIACGFGRHAVWLHQRGWNVTAVDRNLEAIEQIQSTWPAIDARVVDLEQDASVIRPDSFDLVVCWLYHQRVLYPRIRDAVRPGGIVALSALLQGRFAAAPGELSSYFPGWTIVHEAQTEHGPGKRAIEFVAMK